MKFRRTYRFHGLNRPLKKLVLSAHTDRQRVRQTWNKYNLYNLIKGLSVPPITHKTFFQQKWFAKSLTRGYHGEHIKERQWERMFSRRINAVVNMDPKYMALHDGSEQAAGRGSGLKLDPRRKYTRDEKYGPAAGNNLIDDKRTPYMGMTFAPMERRLDIAVHRAMFASSARQARQFVVHGAVTVNGKKMVYPGYQLNPGDLFQVDMDHVLYATGASKNTRRNGVKREKSDDAESKSPEEIEAAAKKRALDNLPAMAQRAKKMVNGDLNALSHKEKRHLRAFVTDAHKTLQYLKEAQKAAAGGEAAAEAEAEAEEEAAEEDGDEESSTAPIYIPQSQWKGIINEFVEMVRAMPKETADAASETSLPVSDESSQSQSSPSTDAADADAAPASEKAPAHKADASELSDLELKRFNELLKLDEQNPYDPSKPYKTPWQPKLYMEHFANIPRYLEVNQNICAAVYLRHPVARPGEAEVPSPFDEHIQQLAFNWYLRRR